jgi:hypothetical protein
METEHMIQSLQASLLETCTTTDETPAKINEKASFQKRSLQTLNHVFSFHACTRNGTVFFSAFVILT